MRTCYEHLGEMRQAMLDDIDSELSHISDMLDHPRPSITILRFACMVLIALRACCLSEAVRHADHSFLPNHIGLFCIFAAKKQIYAQSHHKTGTFGSHG